MKNSQSQTEEEQQHQTHHFRSLTPIYMKIWNLYAWRRGKHSENQQYQQNVIPLATLSNLHDFFGYYTSMKLPSEFQVDSKVMIFQKNSRPMWQDWQNSGLLYLQFKQRSEGGQGQSLDEVWQYLLFNLIGNQFDDEVIGICLNKHQKQTLVQLWLRSNLHRVRIGSTIQTMLHRQLDHISKKLKRQIRFKYKDHRSSIQSQTVVKRPLSLVPNKYVRTINTSL